MFIGLILIFSRINSNCTLTQSIVLAKHSSVLVWTTFNIFYAKIIQYILDYILKQTIDLNSEDRYGLKSVRALKFVYGKWKVARVVGGRGSD